MLLPREFVTYLSRQIVQRITGTAIETHAPEACHRRLVDTVINDEMAAEDRLNDEVRELLEDYSDYMRRESISYQDMFRKIKEHARAEEKDRACFPDAIPATAGSFRATRSRTSRISWWR